MKKNLKNYLLIIVAILFSCNTLWAQDGEIPEINLPGADAVSLMIPIDNPVSLYKGIPDITIPLYTVQCRNFKLPISISYQASGIKVSQEASCVGLGWSLNAGGMISKVVQGYDDFHSYENPVTHISRVGFFYNLNDDEITHDNIELPPPGNTIYDEESDLYYFNFGSYSGKFIMVPGENGVAKGKIIDQGVKLDITIHSMYYISIIDDLGVEYMFYTGEKTKSYSKGEESRLTNEYEIFYPACDYFTRPSTSKWNLTKITLPTDEEINFHYNLGDSESSHQSIVQVSRTVGNHLSESAVLEGILPYLPCPIYPQNMDNYNYSFQQLVAPTLIESITFPSGRIEFTKAPRLDCGGDIPAKMISKIEVFNTIDTINPIKTWDFKYSYFNETYSNHTYKEYFLRLKLDSIGERGLPPYVFNYNDTYSLPAKNSASFDHWGYYNGKDNTYQDGAYYSYILPEFNYRHYSYLEPLLSPSINNPTNAQLDSMEIKPDPIKSIKLDLLYEGADRTASEPHCKAASLESITFPTGGKRDLNFELNDYETDELLITNETADISAHVSPWGPLLESVEEFTIETSTHAHFSSSILYPAEGCPTYSPSNYFVYYVLFREQSPTDYIVSYGIVDNNSMHGESFDIWLSPGNYRLEVYSDGHLGPGAGITYDYLSYEEVDELKGGGLRIKSIKDENKTTYYSYKKENGETSGKLLSKPRYAWLTYQGSAYLDTCDHAFQPIPGSANDIATYLLIRKGSSMNPIVGNAATIGYNVVTEYSVIDGDTLSTTSYFHNEIEYPYTYRLPDLPLKIQHSNGLLKRRETKRNNTLLRTELFNYEKNLETSYSRSTARVDQGWYCHGIYKNTSEWWPMISKQTTEYLGNDSLKNYEQYSYNTKNYKVKESITADSKQDSIYQETLYTIDTDSARFANKNMVSYPVRTENLLGNRLIGGSFIYYNDYGQVDSIYKLNSNSYISGYSPVQNDPPANYDLERSFLYDNLSNNKKLLEYTTKNEFPVSFVWGYYDRTLPIAKVENAHYSEVSPYVSSLISYSIQDVDPASEETFRTALNTFRSNLPNAMVSTYTYDPLVGMTSSTDPSGTTTYYEYDSLNRLIAVLNNEKDIAQSIDYHYYEEPFMHIQTNTVNTNPVGETFTLNVSSNTTGFTITNNYNTWVFDTITGNQVNITTSANNTGENRTATLTFTGTEGGEDQLTINQAEVYLNINQSSKAVNWGGETFTVNVSTNNIDYSVSDTASWITTSKNGSQVSVTVDANTTGSTRNGSVIFEGDQYGSKTLNISQSSQPVDVLTISPTTCYAENIGDYWNIQVSSNTNWSVTLRYPSAIGLSISKTSGSGNSVVRVTYIGLDIEPGDFVPLIGNVIFSTGNISRTLNVHYPIGGLQ